MVLAKALVGSGLALVVAIPGLASPFILAPDPTLTAADSNHPIAAVGTIEQARKEERGPQSIAHLPGPSAQVLLRLSEDEGRDYGGMALRDSNAKTGIGAKISPISQYIANSHYTPSATSSSGDPLLI